MKRQAAFSRPALSNVRPMHLVPNKAAVFCERDCGRYLVVDFADLDHFADDWICPVCLDDELDSYVDALDPFTHSHTNRSHS